MEIVEVRDASTGAVIEPIPARFIPFQMAALI